MWGPPLREKITNKAAPPATTLTTQLEEERKRTEECRADVIQLLSHDTSATRRQLIQVLQGRIEIISAEVGVDSFVVSGGDKMTSVQLEYKRVNEDQVLVTAQRPGEAPVVSLVDVVPEETLLEEEAADDSSTDSLSRNPVGAKPPVFEEVRRDDPRTGEPTYHPKE